jgi:hypothetical protein
MILMTMGASVLMLGLAMLVVAVPSLRHSDARRGSASLRYVGLQTCFTCHQDEHHTYEGSPHPLLIQDSLANPQVIAASFKTTPDVRAVQRGGQTRPYAVKAVSAAQGGAYQPRYLMKTEQGYLPLIEQWNLNRMPWFESSADDWLRPCMGCHATLKGSVFSFDETSGACGLCHTPGDFQQAGTQGLQLDTLRKSIGYGSYQIITVMPLGSQTLLW